MVGALRLAISSRISDSDDFRRLVQLARRYSKPLIGGGGVGLPPFLRSRNLEAYVSLDNEFISLMRIRKAIEQTKGLVVASRRMPSCLSSAWDLEDIEVRFKMGFEFISDEMFFDEMNEVNQKKAQELANELISGAEEVHLDFVTLGSRSNL